uniref:Uncharacterized protein n=1 Tax=Romanomermis culicivorax TaxID=13658 RepID=A0A915IUF1_ROMCU
MDHDNWEVVIITDPPIATTPASGSKGAIEEERLMEIVETEMEKQPKVEKLTEQIKEMKEKIEMLEKEKYGKVAIELAKQLENVNAEEEGTSEEPFVEIVSEIGMYAKAGGQNVENITNPEKFARVMQIKKQMKEKRIAQDENKAELEKVKTGNFQQPAGNPNDRIKYRRGLGKCGQVLNKALKERKYVVDYHCTGRKKDPEQNYVNIQVWKKETDNTDPRIRFWEVIDRKKAHDILEVEKNSKKKVGYRVKYVYNRSAAIKVPRRWVKKYSDGHRREKSETPEKDRKQKHESRQRDEKHHEKSMSKEKRRKENDEESECRQQKECERREKSRERKYEGEKGTKEHKDSRKSWSRKRMPAYFQHDDRLDVSYSSRAASLDRARNNEMTQQGALMCDTNAMIQAQQQQVSYLLLNYPGLPMVGFDCLNRPLFPGQLLASTAVPSPTQFQMPLFPMMQQGPYYHQFLVPPGVQMLPQTMIPPMRGLHGEERMDILGLSTVMQPPQRPLSAANPNYISPLKRDTEIGQPGPDHSGQRHNPYRLL